MKDRLAIGGGKRRNPLGVSLETIAALLIVLLFLCACDAQSAAACEVSGWSLAALALTAVAIYAYDLQRRSKS